MVVETEFIIRIVAAAIVGFLVGLTRRGKGAGPRTFALLCLGCTMLSMIAINEMFVGEIDQTRILAAIVSGIGFLGLGVIWKHGKQPTGLTTAAAIWVAAALGILLGLGLWLEAGAGTVITLLLLWSRKTLEHVGLED